MDSREKLSAWISFQVCIVAIVAAICVYPAVAKYNHAEFRVDRACFIGQEISESGDQWNFTLRYTYEERCQCQEFVYGGVIPVVPDAVDLEEYLVIDEPWLLVDAIDINAAREILGCETIHTSSIIAITDEVSTPEIVPTNDPDTIPYVSYPDCSDPLGMEDGSISDNHITASSYRDSYEARSATYEYFAKNARLNREGTGWRYHPDDNSPWIQVYLGLAKAVTGIKTQGRINSYGSRLWVARCYIKVQVGGRRLLYIKDTTTNTKKEFTANKDSSNIAKIMFQEGAVQTSVIRIEPTACSQAGCELKLEVLGCDSDIFDGACIEPFGLETGTIVDSQMTASEDSSHAHRARLFNDEHWEKGETENLWIQVQTRARNVSGIILQGGLSGGDLEHEKYVTSCYIEYDGDSGPVKTQNYKANFDGVTPVAITFDEPVETSIVKVYPTACVGKCRIRMEIFGICEMKATEATVQQ